MDEWVDNVEQVYYLSNNTLSGFDSVTLNNSGIKT